MFRLHSVDRSFIDNVTLRVNGISDALMNLEA